MPNVALELIELAQRAGLSAQSAESRQESGFALQLEPWPHAPFWLRLESIDGVSVSHRGIVRAEGLSGDRTDIHGLLGALWALSLYSTGNVSLYIDDTPHPAVPYELYARTLLMAPTDSEKVVLEYSAKVRKWFQTVFDATATSSKHLAALFEHNDPREEPNGAPPSWLASVASLTGDNPQSESITTTVRMDGTMWQHFRSFENGIAVYRLTPATMLHWRNTLEASAAATAPINERINDVLNSHEHSAELLKRRSLAESVALRIDESLSSETNDNVIVAMTNSHAFALGRHSLVEVEWDPPNAGGACEECDC